MDTSQSMKYEMMAILMMEMDVPLQLILLKMDLYEMGDHLLNVKYEMQGTELMIIKMLENMYEETALKCLKNSEKMVILIQVMAVVQPVKLRLVGLVMEGIHMILFNHEPTATIVKGCIRMMQAIQLNEYHNEVMEKEQVMKYVMMGTHYLKMGVILIDHKLKIHGYVLEAMLQQ